MASDRAHASMRTRSRKESSVMLYVPVWCRVRSTGRGMFMAVFQPEILERLLADFRSGRLSRRDFVHALGLGSVALAGSAFASACGPAVPANAPTEAARPKPGAATPQGAAAP